MYDSVIILKGTTERAISKYGIQNAEIPKAWIISQAKLQLGMQQTIQVVDCDDIGVGTLNLLELK